MVADTGTQFTVFLTSQCEILHRPLPCHLKVSCGLNKTKTKMQDLALGVVTSCIQGGQCLENAHDSVVDTKAQTDVLIYARFVPFKNRSNSIQLISKMFSKTQQNEWRKEMEHCHPVHAPWVDLIHDNIQLQWEPPPMHQYDGPHRGPCAGPT
jgi:hypothetical protein